MKCSRLKQCKTQSKQLRCDKVIVEIKATPITATNLRCLLYNEVFGHRSTLHRQHVLVLTRSLATAQSYHEVSFVQQQSLYFVTW